MILNPHHAARRLLAIYAQATPECRDHGARWYPEALQGCERLATRHGLPVARVAYAVAAVSPLQPWSKNLSIGAELCRAYVASRTPQTLTFKSRINEGMRALDGERVVKGPKVEAFARAILGDRGACVIDTWMLRAMGWNRAYSPKGNMYAQLAFILTTAAHIARVDVATFQAIVWLAIRDYGVTQ
jgi:hypothetical protein